MQPDVLYLVEHVARELDIACIIRHQLAREHGIETAVASTYFDLHATISRFRPRVVVTPFFYFADDPNIHYLLRGNPGARFVNLAFEQLLSRGNLAFKRPRDTVARRHVLHLANGPLFRDYLCEHDVSPANIRCVGSLPLSLYRPPYQRQAEGHRGVLAQRFGLDSGKPWVFFPENFSAAFMTDAELEYRIRKGYPRGEAYAYRQFVGRALRTIVPWCWGAARRANVELILRPRPATAREQLLRVCQEIAGDPPPRNLHCIKEGSVRQWNLASDMVMSSYSSTLVEAAVAGKPAYLILPEPMPPSMETDWLAHAPRIESQDALQALVSDPSQAQPADRLARWAAEHLGGSGDPIASAADAIHAACLGQGPAPAPVGAIRAAIGRVGCRLRAVTSRRAATNSHYEQDRFGAAQVDQTTAAWVAMLSGDSPRAPVCHPLRNVAGTGDCQHSHVSPATLRGGVGGGAEPGEDVGSTPVSLPTCEPLPAGASAARPLNRDKLRPAVSLPAPAASRRTSPLKVAFVVSARLWGGGESQVALLADGLRHRGHQCRFFARRNTLCATRLREEGFDVETFFGTGRDPVSLWRIRCGLARWRPDVLHLNDSHAITCGGIASRGLEVPAHVASRRSLFPIRSADRYRRYAARIICVADVVAQRCRAAGIPDAELRIVYDGTSPVHFEPPIRQRVRAQLGLNASQPVLLTVAWLNPLKGHRYLLDALPAILAEYPDLALLLAGAGSEREALEQQVQQLGFAQHVRFLGYRRDVPQLIQASDLFVMPTLSEGLCSSLIDAMLGGLPIVTTSVGGIVELVGPDHLSNAPVAWTVPEQDSAALAAAVCTADPQERATRATRARQRAQIRFTADRMVEGTLEVYHELLADT
jgi:glycosyltransferase involved in cell wall biosynthesis